MSTLAKSIGRGANNFDLLRLLAAIAVIVGHGYPIVGDKTHLDPILSLVHYEYSGSLAVKFFFFLSGLLVTESLVREKSVLAFLVKRASRIFPGLVLCMILSVFVAGPLMTTQSIHEYFYSADAWRYLIGNSSLVSIQWRLPGVLASHGLGFNGSIWTLPYEVLCYIGLSLLFVAGFFLNNTRALLVLLLVVLVSVLSPVSIPYFSSNEEAFLLPAFFAAGALVCIVKDRLVLDGKIALIACVAAYILASTPLGRPLFYVAFFYSSLVLATARFMLKIVPKSDMSYGVYLYGFPVQQILNYMFPNAGVYFNQAAGAIVACAFAYISWVIIEQRALIFGRKFAAKISKIDQIFQAPSCVSEKRSDRFQLFTECARVVLVVLLAYWIALEFIYPGYFDPLWPNHTDYYMPLAVSNYGVGPLSFLGWPRPIGMMFLWLLGMFGLHGSILFVVLTVLVNIAGTSMLVRRVFGVPDGWKFLCGVFAVSFSAFILPSFYSFYTHDTFAHASYALLLAGGWLWWSCRNEWSATKIISVFVIALLAFLTKETFGVAAVFMSLMVCFRATGKFERFYPCIAVCAALVIALVYSVAIGSQFVNVAANSVADPYRINISPVSIVVEWFRYAREGMGWVGLFGVLVSASALLVFSKSFDSLKSSYFVLLAAGFLVWLPNSLLPNHHYAGYAWSAVYLVMAPVAVAAALLESRVISTALLAVIVGASVVYGNTSRNKYDEGEWVRTQENTQKNLVRGLELNISQVPVGGATKRVLVTGLSFPFSPFEQPLSLKYFDQGRHIVYSVMEYGPSKGVAPTDFVRFVKAGDVVIGDYMQIWGFNKDGERAFVELNPGRFVENISKGLGSDIDAKILLLYPALRSELLDGNGNIQGQVMGDGYKLLKIGQELMDYGDALDAEYFLGKASTLLPDNPYPSFFLGKVAQQKGDLKLAEKYYREAVDLQGGGNKNVYFEDALRRVKSLLSGS